MARIAIFDTTLRDGEQSPGSSLTASEKLRMAHEIAALGVDVLEAGVAAGSKDDEESIRAIALEVQGPVIAALARADTADIDRCAASLEGAARARIHLYLPTSDDGLEHGLGIGRSEALDRIGASVRRARTLGDDVQFSAQDASRTDIDFLCEVIGVAVAAGATSLNVPDSAGYALPGEVGSMIRSLLERVRGLSERTVSTHCYDDLGLALANSLAAVEAGARQVECTINGIGKRAGSAALEEVVMAIAVRSDGLGHETGVHTERLHRTSRLLTYLTGIEPQPNKAVVGRNAFAHVAGSGQEGHAGSLRRAIMTPEMVGAPGGELPSGTLPGRQGLESRYEALGYTLTPEELARVGEAFTALAGRKKTVLDEDLLSILHHGVMEDVPERYRLTAIDVRCGADVSEASVELSARSDPPRSAEGTGDGPIAATFAALDSLLDFRVTLQDLTIRSATPGGDALGEVTIHASIDGHTFTGRAAHTDVVRASADAFLHAVNKAAAARVLEEKHLAATSDVWGV